MVLARFGNIGTRVVLLISAAVVLGLSVWLANQWSHYLYYCSYLPDSDDQGSCRAFFDRWPSSSKYSAFVGAFGLLAALFGFLPTFLGHGIVSLIAIGIDVLSTIFFLAGAINLVVLRNKYNTQYTIDPLCTAVEALDSDRSCSTLRTRITADIAFLWIGFIFSLFGVVLLFLIRRNNK